MTRQERSNLPRASLVICTRNRQQLLLETVELVLNGKTVPAEIIIVDQSDAALSMVVKSLVSTACEIRYFHLRCVGASRARNIGIQLAKNEMIAFLDDDMFVADNWFQRLIQSLHDSGPRSVVTGRVLAEAVESEDGYIPALVTSQVPKIFQGRVQADVLASGHMASYQVTLKEVGCFDERLGPGTTFPSAEDNDLGFRLLEAGYTLVYEPEAVVYHRAWRSKGDYFPMRWSYGYGQGGFYAKHLNLKDPFMLKRMIRDIGRRARRFPGRIIHQPEGAVGDMVFVLAMLSGAAHWLLTQSDEKEIQHVPAEN